MIVLSFDAFEHELLLYNVMEGANYACGNRSDLRFVGHCPWKCTHSCKLTGNSWPAIQQLIPTHKYTHTHTLKNWVPLSWQTLLAHSKLAVWWLAISNHSTQMAEMQTWYCSKPCRWRGRQTYWHGCRLMFIINKSLVIWVMLMFWHSTSLLPRDCGHGIIEHWWKSINCLVRKSKRITQGYNCTVWLNHSNKCKQTKDKQNEMKKVRAKVWSNELEMLVSD